MIQVDIVNSAEALQYISYPVEIRTFHPRSLIAICDRGCLWSVEDDRFDSTRSHLSARHVFYSHEKG